MSLKRIHVNQHVIRSNKQHGQSLPVLTVKSAGKNRYASRVNIKGPSSLVYEPDNPLSCGARVWIETHADVELLDEMTFDELTSMQKMLS